MSNPEQTNDPKSDNDPDEKPPEYQNSDFEIDPQIFSSIAPTNHLEFQDIEKIMYPSNLSDEKINLILQRITQLEEQIANARKPIDYSKVFNDVVYYSTLARNFELCINGKSEYMLDLAFKEASEVKEPYWKVKSFTAIYASLHTFAQAKAKLALDEAFIAFKQIYEPFSKAKAASDIAIAIANTDPNDSLNWAEEAINIAENIKDKQIMQSAVYSVINIVAKISPTSSWNAFLTIDNNTDSNERFIRNRALLSISIEFSKKDPFKALEQAELIGDQYMKDEALAFIVISLLSLNRKKALALVQEIKDPIWNSKVLYKITTTLFTIKPKKAYALAMQIKDPYWENKTLLNFANKLFTMKYKTWKKIAMLSLTKALHIPDHFSKAKSLSEFSVLISRSKKCISVARAAAKLALKVAKLIKDPFSRTVALLDVLKAFSFLDLEESTDVDDLLLDNAAKLDDDLMRNQALVLISNWLLDKKKINDERIEMYAKYEADKAFTETELELIFDDFEIQKTLETFHT